MKEIRKHDYAIWIIAIIIILLLILSSSTFSYFGKIGAIPTGNIDIFNIECTKDDNDKEVCSCNGEEIKDPITNKPVNGNDILGNFYVNDKDKEWDGSKWDSINKLRIFTNPAFEYKNIIAPGSSNSYQFVINNSNNSRLVYTLEFFEKNPYKINMRYKIKRNGKYILNSKDRWLKYSEIHIRRANLANYSHDVYNLEWKWVDDDNDEIIGMNESTYSLQINIKGTM